MQHLFKETVEVDVYDVARVGVEQNIFAVSITQSSRARRATNRLRISQY